MMMFVGELGGWAAAAAGAYENGKQWFVAVQLAPRSAVNEAMELQARAASRAAISVDPQTFAFNVAEMYSEARERIESGLFGAPRSQVKDAISVMHQLPRTIVAQATIVELTGYPLTDLVRNYDGGCAFPGEDHHCASDAVTDAVATWYERGPGQKHRG